MKINLRANNSSNRWMGLALRYLAVYPNKELYEAEMNSTYGTVLESLKHDAMMTC